MQLAPLQTPVSAAVVKAGYYHQMWMFPWSALSVVFGTTVLACDSLQP
jgi:hypothetical protein